MAVVESRYYPGTDESDEDPPVRIIGVPAKIRTQRFSNVSMALLLCEPARSLSSVSRQPLCQLGSSSTLIIQQIHFLVHRARRIEAKPSNPISLESILLSPAHLILDIPTVFSPSSYWAKTSSEFSAPPITTT